jgi:anaerobic selenocysteine-containing dehydrogenase
VQLSAESSVEDETEHENHFRLLSPKVAGFVHSQRIESSTGHRPGTVHIHPDDMESAGVVRGDTLELRSPRGAVLARVESDLNLIRGTIWIEEGLWADPEDGIDPEGSPNLLTSVEGTAESVSCIMHGIELSARRHR